MTEVREYTLQFSELQDYFRSFTPEQLERYDKDIHGKTIESISIGYLLLLLEAVGKKRYPIAGDVVTVCSQVGGGKPDREFGVYIHEDGRREEFDYKELPPEELEDLKEETGLAFRVLDGFKKINWKLDRQLKNQSEDPELDQDLDYYVSQLHDSLVSISQLHHSERNRAFVMDSSDGPNLRVSNGYRNSLYHFIDVVLERKKHPLIDK